MESVLVCVGMYAILDMLSGGLETSPHLLMESNLDYI